MQEVRGGLDGRSSSTPDESRSPRVELLRLTVVTARERIHSGEGERLEPTGPGPPHVLDRRIYRPHRRVTVPASRWCVVIHRSSPPEETARIARLARAEGQHTERVGRRRWGGSRDVALEPRTDRSRALRLSRSSFSKVSCTF